LTKKNALQEPHTSHEQSARSIQAVEQFFYGAFFDGISIDP